MAATRRLAQDVGARAACEALGVPRASYYRYQSRLERARRQGKRPASPLALTCEEQRVVLALLHAERFVDKAPPEVYATLLDEGSYHCSIRTMYRLLAREGEVRERRGQRRRVHYRKPELLATGPNQVWSWDITKLKGPVKWSYYYLYVILDIYSRYVVGWMVAHRESAALAHKLIQLTCDKQGIRTGQLTIHADRGSSMTSKPVALLLADLGVTKTHSRPQVSNDNPYSEAQFKTLKYRPNFPERFGSLEDARAFCQPFFGWYNTEHRHSGIGMLTPAMVHDGRAPQVVEGRAKTLQAAFEAHPERFKGKKPAPLSLPEAVWINRPLEVPQGAEAESMASLQ
jgi:putative transposase